MNIRRTLRFSIINFNRVWNRATRKLCAEIAYILAPLDGKKNHPANNRRKASNNESNTPQAYEAVERTTAELIPSENDQAKGNKKTYSRRENVKFVFELLGIAGGIIGVVFLIGQYNEMVKATKATLKSVEVSQGQMNVMSRQLDDSEAQQRALLEFGQFTMKKTTNSIAGLSPGANFVEVAYTIKNVGYTPAIDLAGSGVVLLDKVQAMYKKAGITNSLHKWDSSETPTPSPFTGGKGIIGIMPQETITNIWGMSQEWESVGSVYIEQWISYRDIFWHPWIIGEGGHYDVTNDCFVREFIYSGQYRQGDQTNSASQNH